MCGVFGILSYKNQLQNTKQLVRELAYFSTARGMDATGFAYVENGKMNINKQGLNAYEFDYNLLPDNPQVLIGHTRKLTVGKAKFNENNHPFVIDTLDGQVAFAHNGVIYNLDDLRYELDLPETEIETDSYVVAQMLEQLGSVNFNTIREVSEQVEGHLVFTFLTEQNEIYLVKGDNPLSIIHFPTIGLYVYASTEDILMNAVTHFEQTSKLINNEEYEMIDVYEGDMLLIKNTGEIQRDYFTFNNPDSYSFAWNFVDSAVPEKYRKRKNSGFGWSFTEQDYFDLIVEFARSRGLTEDDIFTLIDEGYALEEIEELLYTPEVLYDILVEIEFSKKMKMEV